MKLPKESNCGYWRNITLLNTIYKILATIMQNRLTCVEHTLCDEQVGFRYSSMLCRPSKHASHHSIANAGVAYTALHTVHWLQESFRHDKEKLNLSGTKKHKHRSTVRLLSLSFSLRYRPSRRHQHAHPLRENRHRIESQTATQRLGLCRWHLSIIRQTPTLKKRTKAELARTVRLEINKTKTMWANQFSRSQI